ncbi:MAG: hypothetical protein II620_03325, partial [Paludibacteraceae bacterium]|nr:hypothetical protein [Paludibacteraceae bacterium]
MRINKRVLIILLSAIVTTTTMAEDALDAIVEAYNPTAAQSDTITEKADPTESVITADQLPDFSYENPRTYEIEEITVSGKNNYDDFVLIGYSGLKKGERIMIPGDDLTNVIRRFWKQGLFANIKVEVVSIRGNKVWININLDQRPKVSKINIMGVKKKEREELEKGMDMTKGTQVTPYAIEKTKKYITRYFRDKGFYNVKVSVTPREDDASGMNNIVDIRIDKGNKIKVNRIYFEGNNNLSNKKLDRAMKKTNDRHNILNIFRAKKFVPSEYENDKKLLIEKYNEHGFRDAVIVDD